MKKAQSGMNAAVLVAIIAGLIILYILFLPSVEREQLLEGEVKAKGGDNGNDKDVLLREFPGRLDVIDNIGAKNIPNIFLFEETNSKILDTINPLVVRNGIFDKKPATASFSLEDIENTDNVMLTFTAEKHKGTLTIKLNGQSIYENSIDSLNPEPIKLRKSALERDNTLEFSVSGVGVKFWSTNEYSLDGIQVVGDITDKSRQEALNVFTLTGEEFYNIDEATLKFIPYCSGVQNVGRLDVSINSKNVFSAVPVCEDPYKQVIPTGVFNIGENRIIFKTGKGSYSVEQIRLDFKAKEQKTKVYFFEVNSTLLKDIEDNDKDVELRLEFVEDRENKRADINVNDRFLSLDQEEKAYSKAITDRIKEGNNFIEIRPRTELDIVEIKVEVVD
ncbi:hypothetical protein J4212_07870 [Candidatus Woesearchaeota archaeon]|nr:hypothetical protein [Candidatus Woesearchaeota archaeon]